MLARNGRLRGFRGTRRISFLYQRRPLNELFWRNSGGGTGRCPGEFLRTRHSRCARPNRYRLRWSSGKFRDSRHMRTGRRLSRRSGLLSDGRFNMRLRAIILGNLLRLARSL